MTNTAGYYVTFTVTFPNDTKQFEKFGVVKYANITEFEQNHRDNFKDLSSMLKKYLFLLPEEYVVNVIVDNCSNHPPTNNKYIDMEDIQNWETHFENIFK